jgi:hypothetical protein
MQAILSALHPSREPQSRQRSRPGRDLPSSWLSPSSGWRARAAPPRSASCCSPPRDLCNRSVSPKRGAATSAHCVLGAHLSSRRRGSGAPEPLVAHAEVGSKRPPAVSMPRGSRMVGQERGRARRGRSRRGGRTARLDRSRRGCVADVPESVLDLAWIPGPPEANSPQEVCDTSQSTPRQRDLTLSANIEDQ